jgi:hypothetical protein
MTEIVGRPPALAGLACAGFVCQGFVNKGEPVQNAGTVYLRFSETWYRLIIDCGVIIWRDQTEAPEPWSVESEGWDYPHVDVGAAAGIVGERLQDYQMTTGAGRGCVTFKFANGRSVFIENNNDVSTYRIG